MLKDSARRNREVLRMKAVLLTGTTSRDYLVNVMFLPNSSKLSVISDDVCETNFTVRV